MARANWGSPGKRGLGAVRIRLPLITRQKLQPELSTLLEARAGRFLRAACQ